MNLNGELHMQLKQAMSNKVFVGTEKHFHSLEII